MLGPVMPRPSTGLPRPRLAARDAAAEAVAGIVQRPGRAVLTMLGTVLGVGAFVAVLGMTATGAGQISHQFTVLQDTTVTVEDNGPANDVAPPDANPAIGFPGDADAVARHINGVTAAGVWWPVSLPQGTNFTGSLALSAAASQTISLLAASPGAVQAMRLRMSAGSPLTAYENDSGQHVAVIDTATATALGDLAGLFLILALVSLFIGAVGIANTTLVAVLERTEEIGLRRAVGARPRHIAAQFLAESTALGTLGGLIGTCIGVGTVVIFAAAKDWTAVLNPAYTLPAPLIGSVVGLLAGAYPALRAARTSPLAALRHA